MQDEDYAAYESDENLYDEYKIALEGMSLSLYQPNYSIQETNFSLIDDISIELKI